MGGIRDDRHSPLSFRYDRGKAFTPNKILWPEMNNPAASCGVSNTLAQVPFVASHGESDPQRLKRPSVARPGIFFGHNERFGDRTRRRKITEGVQPQRRFDWRFALYKAAITQALFEFTAAVRASFAGRHRLKAPF